MFSCLGVAQPGRGDMVLWIAVKEGIMRFLVLSLALLPTLSEAQDVTLSGSALIDQQISKVWADDRISNAEISTDAEYLRRLSLDLLGVLPTPEETVEFLKDPNPG